MFSISFKIVLKFFQYNKFLNLEVPTFKTIITDILGEVCQVTGVSYFKGGHRNFRKFR